MATPTPDTTTTTAPPTSEGIAGNRASTVGSIASLDPGESAEAGVTSVPTFLNVFQNIAAYGDLLDEDSDSGEDSERSSLSDAHQRVTSPIPIDVSIEKPAADPEVAETKAKELAATSRLAQLSVNAWSAAGSGLDGSAKAETVVSEAGDLKEVPGISAEEAARKLKATGNRVIPLIIKEFGPIAEAGDEEQLVAEADAAYFRQVAILGLVHVTTHRITFHASLLQTREDEHPGHQIIKSGRATVHREGLHRKKRVWLELTHDMISSFPDSTDEGRVRPLRTILLSGVKDIVPLDTEDPRSCRLSYETPWGIKASHVEFDTIESAASWRREVTGALHEYRIRRQSIMDPASTLSQHHGVRWSIPLHRIGSFDTRTWASFANVITFNLTSPGGSSDNLPTPAHSLPTIREDEDIPAEDRVPGSAITSLTITIIQGFDIERLRGDIDAAKKRRVGKPATTEHADDVTVDFGELSIAEKFDGPHAIDAPSIKEMDQITELGVREFGLSPAEQLWHSKCAILRMTRSAGYLLVSPHFVCFWSKGLMSNTKLRFPIHSVSSAQADESDCVVHLHKLVLLVKGQPDIVLHFRSSARRNEAVELVNKHASIAKDKVARHSSIQSIGGDSINSQYFPPSDSSFDTTAASASHSPTATVTEELAPIAEIIQRTKDRVIPKEILVQLPKAINIPRDHLAHIEKQHFACLTIGSRGDIQPYIALCIGLKKEGHQVTIVTHEEYKGWIEGFGIQHLTAGGDPGALMKLSVEHKMFSPQFFKESLGHFRKWLDDLLKDSYEQVKASGATVLIESPSAMAGLHIAEALDIPYFRAFTMPWSRTEEYPHAFISPPDLFQGSFNYSTYVIFDNVFWRALSPQINRWRKKMLGLPSTDLEHMQQTKIPFLYNFSPQVVPKPLDWSDTTIITGYWFLDNPDPDWAAPESLLEFMAGARADGKPLVYIGFGSIVVEDPKAMTRSIVKAVLKSGVRAILNKGWSARMASNDATPEVELPPQIYSVDKIPHDWLFPQIDAALHHGGAGTTGASLRAGIPTLIKPWFGDQFFWASRVQKLGAGIRVASLSSSEIAHALTKATTNRVIKEKAQGVGERIREEHGVNTAISALYMYLHRAGSRPAMLKKHLSRTASHRSTSGHVKQEQAAWDEHAVQSPITSVAML